MLHRLLDHALDVLADFLWREFVGASLKPGLTNILAIALYAANGTLELDAFAIFVQDANLTTSARPI